jgi:hypothetical protein
MAAEYYLHFNQDVFGINEFIEFAKSLTSYSRIEDGAIIFCDPETKKNYGDIYIYYQKQPVLMIVYAHSRKIENDIMLLRNAVERKTSIKILDDDGVPSWGTV